jgi:hypothetical protein
MKKRNVFLMGILALMLVFGFALTGCSDDSSGGGGTLELFNASTKSANDTITHVTILLNDTVMPKIDESVSIPLNSSKSWSLEAGGYTVYVTSTLGEATGTAGITAGGKTVKNFSGTALQ